MFQLRLMDSKSIPLFYLLRQGWARSLHEDGYQFGKAEKGRFFRFKSHCRRDPPPALTEVAASVVCLGDLGYCGCALPNQLWEDTDALLPTPADADTGQAKALASSPRKWIRTTFSQLWSLFVDCAHSRSRHGLST